MVPELSTPVAAGLAAVLGAGAGYALAGVADRLPRGAPLIAGRRGARPPHLLAAALASAVLCAAVVAVDGPGPDGLLGVVLVLVLIPVALTDLEHRIIPNRLTAAGAAAALALLALTAPGALPGHLVAGAGAGGFLLVAALLRPDGMGMGDVKLAGVLGLFLGSAVVPALLAALVAGSLAGLAILVRLGVREGRTATFPFGPYLAFGGVVGLLAA